MKIDLTGKLAIVSGSTAGIGLGISKALAECGATVVVIGRDTTKVDQALASIRQSVPGAQLRGLTADLGTAEGAEHLFAAEPQADILVNNLGIFKEMDFFDTPDSEWTRFYEINVISGVRLSRHYVPGMVSKGWGRVIFLSSESGIAIPPDMLNYGVTKSANLAVSHGLAKRLAGTGVTVNAVLPGPTLTDGVEEMLKDAAAESGRSLRQKRLAALLLGSMAVFSASPVGASGYPVFDFSALWAYVDLSAGVSYCAGLAWQAHTIG